MKLFRVQPEITTLGTGTKVIRLPKEYWITADVGIITLALLPIAKILVVPLSLMLGVPSLGKGLQVPIEWFLAFIISFLTAVYLRRFEPEGKSIIKWVLGYINYLIKPKWSDGWTTFSPGRSEVNFKLTVNTYMTNCNICASIPAKGKGIKKFALYTRANIKIRRTKVSFYPGKDYFPGIYEIEKGQIIRISDLPSRVKKGGSN